MKILEDLIDKPLIVYLSSVFIVLISLFAFSKLPIEDVPKIVIPFVRVQVHYPGAASEEIETQIVRKLEDKMETIDNIKDIYSISSEGVGTVMVEFYDTADKTEAYRDVQDKVDSVRREFPEDAEDPIVTDLDLDNMPILLVNLYGDASLFQLKEASKDVKPVIENVAGVAEVVTFGGLEREIHVNVDPTKSATYGVTYEYIARALKTQNVNFPGGHIGLGGNEYLIRTLGKFNSVSEIGNTIIYSNDNKLLKLYDIAKITDSYKKVKTISRLNGLNSVTLAVRKQGNINTLKTIQSIRDEIEKIKPTLPHGIKVGLTHDKSQQIRRMIHQLGVNAIYGGILVVFILFVTMGFRNSILISMAIPFSLLTTFLFLKIFGMSISSIALFSMILILGLVVDGAIIVGENIYEKFEQGLKGTNAAKEGIIEVAWPVVSSDITTIAAFLPMLLVTGVSGQFLSVIPKVIAFALGGSIIIDHIIIPTVAARFMKVKKRKPKIEVINSADNSKISGSLQTDKVVTEEPSIATEQKRARIVTSVKTFIHHGTGKIRKYYYSLLENSLNNPKKVILLTMVAVAICVTLIVSGFLGFEFFPKVDIGKFNIDFETTPGSNIEQTDIVASKIEKYLTTVPEIVSFVTTIGNTHALKSDIREGGKEGPEYAKISIELAEASEREKTQTEILKKIKSDIGEMPGIELTYFELREGPATGAEIAIRVTGNDMKILANISDTIASNMRTIEGAKNVRSDFRKGRSELKINVNREKASIYNVDANDIANAVSKSFLGYVAADIDIDNEEVDIRIQNKEFFKRNIGDIHNVFVTSARGGAVPLGEVAKVTFGKSISDIRRFNQKRSIIVRSDVVKGYRTDSIKKKLRIMMEKNELPHGYFIKYGGESEQRDTAIKELMYSMVLGVILIYFILAVQFNSYKQPCMILIAIPLSFVGVVLGLVLTRNNFGFMAFVGMIALTGIVVNDSIVLLSYANQLVKNGCSVFDAAMQAGLRRLRPVLMTTVTTIGGLLPLSLNLGGGGEFWVPMGWSIIFGIGVATFLTLVIIPVAFNLLGGGKKHTGIKS